MTVEKKKETKQKKIRRYRVTVSPANAMVQPKVIVFKFRKTKKGGSLCLKNKSTED